MSAKRHLPVLSSNSALEGPSLSNLQWGLLGALSIFACSLPLGVVGLWGSFALSKWLGHDASGAWQGSHPAQSFLTILPLVFSFAIASFGGATLVGRFALGSRATLPIYSGLLAALLIVVLASLQGALRPHGLAAVVLLVLALVSSVFAALGGHVGRKFRA